jgi:GMP synthase-like glutamine amidotransferase
MKPILIVQNCPFETAGSTVDYCRERKLPHTLVHSYAGHALPDPSEISAALVMGCPESVSRLNEFEYLRNLYQFIAATVRANRPYLGVCFGGQILAKVLGAEVKPNPVKEIGATRITLTEAGKSDPLFDGFPPAFDVFQWHGDTFKIPFGAELLAESVDCKNQAFRKGNLVGLQFHLETPLDEAGVWCDQYQQELAELQRTREQVLTGYKPVVDDARALNFKLLDNFFQRIVPTT